MAAAARERSPAHLDRVAEAFRPRERSVVNDEFGEASHVLYSIGS